MRRFKFHKAVFAIVILFQNCNLSDSTKQLGDGYFFRNEGDEIKDILCEHVDGGEVPASVLDLAYDENFILAKQKPKLPQDVLYKKEYNYKKGSDAIYYWIVIKSSHSVLGPLDDVEYKKAREENKIPDNLEIE